MSAKVLLAYLAIMAPIAGISQLSAKQVQTELTNNNKKSWDFKEFRETLGEECRGEGARYTFIFNGKLVVKKCVNNQVQFNTLSWKLEPVGMVQKKEWKLVFSKPLSIKDTLLSEVRIGFKGTNAAKKNQVMTWRTSRTCKTCETFIIEFTAKE